MIKKVSTKPSAKTASKATGKGQSKKAASAKQAETKAEIVQDDLLNEPADKTVLDRLYDVVLSRKDTDPSVSHSARLLSRGTYKIAQKFGEEAVECLIEAVAGRKDLLVGESADVLYHLVVLWVDAGVTPEEVWAELRRREGVSGIAEKASRPKETFAKKDK
ncbi:phosphoribosyl ATP pyrophosphatase [Acetobacter tropicalis NRIC 0312]|uniref:Phosphoribosyl-ATP pyrophosphatase n=1 Tax=Acetobacter tropicalis TaxID=104102 RepID=A0A0C9LIL7_9PROT|nr:phosphoribosyl-ATP diphosphatase [Acetobacter tropicalis]KXV49841.1 phosphoribosyl-ATP pyrophosphatase [Acetobacter tropicalis]KXV57549.1 phosphoribosyl-ATP pyrophosphatase [Acetobacter tropicalis]OUI86746.1 phosphoribosyl-ATP pyrophosphatase [Acetobacter tropicalis]GAL96589.1 phosphoribosyl-ATP pyrophosphatase [Acetobacter tropicalis]GBR69332.1 phosphoribosyl ATP pyrophosphatase [Acetobacter tropicalis NRIC 0312]